MFSSRLNGFDLTTDSWTSITNVAKTDTYIFAEKSMLHLVSLIGTTCLNPHTNEETNDHTDITAMIVLPKARCSKAQKAKFFVLWDQSFFYLLDKLCLSTKD